MKIIKNEKQQTGRNQIYKFFDIDQLKLYIKDNIILRSYKIILWEKDF